jgi:transposase
VNIRIIGIDLAVTAQHKAIVLEQGSNAYVSNLLTFHTDPAEIDKVLTAARADASVNTEYKAVMEATGMSWFVIGQYLERAGVAVYRVNGQQVSELRRIYKRRAKSDRIDARVLARLPLLYPERLHRCFFPSGQHMSLQRACREVERLTEQVTASKNRLLATDQFVWLGLANIMPPYEQAALWVREQWYNPWRVCQAGDAAITQAWQDTSTTQPADTRWIPALLARARQVVTLYGDPHRLDYDQLQASLTREQQRMLTTQQLRHQLRLKTVRPIYRTLYPDRHLESLQGVGQDSAAIYHAFIGDISRFPSLREFRGWSGMIPYSSQSGYAEVKGLHITKAGPDLVKTTLFQNAEIARLWDPQIAAIYYTQMMDFGKHHLQAICACATHLLDRIYAILKENRPYELRDVDGTPLDKRQARLICQQQYKVPDAVRRRNNQHARKARAQARLERKHRRRRRK